MGVMGRGLRVGRAYKKRWVSWEGDLGAGLGKRSLKGGRAWQVELTRGGIFRMCGFSKISCSRKAGNYEGA